MNSAFNIVLTVMFTLPTLTLAQIITKICCCLCSLSVTPQIDMSNQLCPCKYNKECGVESVIYSAIWFRSNLFYSAFFGRISVNLFGMPVPDIPWIEVSMLLVCWAPIMEMFVEASVCFLSSNCTFCGTPS